MESAETWLNEENWSTDPAVGVKYVEVKTIDTGGEYAFDFYLDKSGTYDCIIAAKDVSESFKIIYTNKDENTALLEELATAQSEAAVETILLEEGSLETLMLTESSIYADVISDTTESNGTKPSYKIAEIIYAAERKAPITHPYEFIETAEKAALIVALNGDTSIDVTDVDDYKGTLLLNKLGIDEYYRPEGSSYLTDILKRTKITDIEDFEVKLRDAVIFTNIKYGDSIDNVKSMLEQFFSDLGVTEGQITTACVRSMLGREFDLIRDIGDYINNYDGGSSGNSGTIGGSASSGGASFGGGASGRGTVNSATYSNVYENPEGSTEVIVPFEDLDDVSWAVPAITALYTRGIVVGKSEKSFSPNDYITREEFVKLLTTAFELNVLGSGMNFEDVTEEDWYYDYVRSAYYADIVRGISNTMFGAGQNITRQDIAVMSQRAAEISNVVIDETAQEFVFGDEDAVAEYAYAAVKLMQRGGIINGDENGNFNPTSYATRAEVAKIIYNLLLLI